MSNSQEEIQAQYSPSVWSKRFSNPEDVVIEHRRFVAEESDRVKSTIPNQCDIPYGDTDGQKLDLFGFDVLPEDAPIYVYIHGGYWQMLSRSVSAYVVEPLFRAGIAVVVVGYDLAPSVSLDEICAQIIRAAKFILQKAATRKSRGVFFSGHSAGGHLVAMLANSDCFHDRPDLAALIKGYICFSGLFELRQVIQTTYNEALQLSVEDAERNTPTLHVNGACSTLSQAHVLVMVGENDSPEFQRHSCRYAEALAKKGVKATYKTVSHVDHFEIVEKLSDSEYSGTKAVLDMIERLTSITSADHHLATQEESKQES